MIQHNVSLVYLHGYFSWVPLKMKGRFVVETIISLEKLSEICICSPSPHFSKFTADGLTCDSRMVLILWYGHRLRGIQMALDFFS